MDDVTNRRRRGGATLPLHAKSVGLIRLQKLLELPMSDKARADVTDAWKWVNDATVYAPFLERYINAPIRRPARCSLSQEDIDIMLTLDRYAEIDGCEVLAYCNSFARVEIMKLRRRHILEPLLNDYMSQDAFKHFSLVQRSDIRKNLRRYNIQFDAASFFDQFPLAWDVSRLMCIRADGKSYAYRTLPMGCRISCIVAQATLNALLDFDTTATVWRAGYIDNVLFTSDDRDAVIKHGETFVARCAHAGVTLNDAEKDVASRVEQEFDFLGEHYNTTGAEDTWTRKNTSKTVTKLRAASLAVTTRYTWRQLAAFAGLLLFASSITDTCPAQHFTFLTYYRQAMAAGDKKWNAPIPLSLRSDAADNDLAQWLQDATLNNAQPLRDNDDAPQLTMWVDASRAGWGALVQDASGAFRSIGAPWSDADHARWNLSSSVASEPLALRRAILACANNNTTVIQAFTDHKPLTYAAQAGYAKAFAYNDTLLTIRSIFPKLRLRLAYIEGQLNTIADGISRSWGQGEGAAR